MFSSDMFLLIITPRSWRYWKRYMWKHNPEGVLLESDHSLIAKHKNWEIKARRGSFNQEITHLWSQPLAGGGKRTSSSPACWMPGYRKASLKEESRVSKMAQQGRTLATEPSALSSSPQILLRRSLAFLQVTNSAMPVLHTNIGVAYLAECGPCV